MNESKALGLVLGSAIAPEKLAPLTRDAEALGFDELWFSEDCFFTGGISSAAIALASTARVRVGLGVVSAMLRHPALLAMEVATLARAFPQRLTVGVGLGVPAWLRQVGRMPASPLSAVSECVASLRELLGGERLERSGEYFSFDGVALAHPAGDVPIHLGVLGRKMLQLSGEIADGSILSVCAGADYVRWARRQIEEGVARRDGEPSGQRVTVFSLYAVDPDEERARQAVRRPLAFYLAADGVNDLTRTEGVADAVAEISGRGGVDALVEEMPHEWLDRLAVCGAPEQCAARVRQLYEAGADSVALFPVDGARLSETVRLTARTVSPLLSQAPR